MSNTVVIRSIGIQGAPGGISSPVTAASITDSSAAGRALLTAVDASAQRNAIAVEATQFRCTGSGLVLSVAAGRVVDQSGDGIEYAGGTVTLPASSTVYVFLDLFDLSLQALKHGVHRGGVLLAKCATGASTITTVSHPPSLSLPRSRCHRVMRKLQNGQTVRVALVGTSITEATYVVGFSAYPALLFDAAQSAAGYNVPSVANVTFVNYAASGMTAEYGFCWFGDAVGQKLGGSTTDYRDSGIAMTHYHSALLPAPAAAVPQGGSSPIVGDMPDLLVIEHGMNPTTYTMQLIESMIRKARLAGIEVLLLTTNFQTSSQTYLESSIDTFARLAEQYGCEIADTWSYIYRDYVAGVANVMFDAVHPGSEGHKLYARAIRGILHGRYSLQEAESPYKGQRILANGLTNTQRSRQPDMVHNQWAPHITTGSNVAATVTDPAKNPAVGFSNRATVTTLTTGQYANFAHPGFLAATLLFESNTTWTARLTTDAGTVVLKGSGGLMSATELSWTSLGTRVASVPLMTLDEVAALTGFGFGDSNTVSCNMGVRIEVTSGTLKIVGVAFHVPEQEIIPFEEMRFVGTWAIEVGPKTGTLCHYSDTTGDMVIIPFRGRTLQLVCSANGSGGQIECRVDAKMALTSNTTGELYKPGSYTRTFHITPQSNPGSPDAMHVAWFKIAGVNGAAAAVSTLNRRFAILSASVIK